MAAVALRALALACVCGGLGPGPAVGSGGEHAAWRRMAASLCTQCVGHPRADPLGRRRAGALHPRKHPAPFAQAQTARGFPPPHRQGRGTGRTRIAPVLHCHPAQQGPVHRSTHTGRGCDVGYVCPQRCGLCDLVPLGAGLCARAFPGAGSWQESALQRRPAPHLVLGLLRRIHRPAQPQPPAAAVCHRHQARHARWAALCSAPSRWPLGVRRTGVSLWHQFL